MSEEEDLTPGERAAFQALQQRTEPSRLLEERTERALRELGLLRKPRRRFGPSQLVAAVAAAAVLYLGGVATGQWLASRQTTEVLTVMQENHAREAAALVQRTGSAYAQAIAGLSRVNAAPDSHYVIQGREVALNALYTAANELVRLSPDDPVVVRILQVLNTETVEPDTARPSQPQRVIWF